jgi:RNA polymerase sigma-70 factor (ECF subfamily)
MNGQQLSAALERALMRFGALVGRVGARHGLANSEVDDLMQEVRIRMWKALGTSEKIQGAPASYVYRTAMSAAVDLLRARRARRAEVSSVAPNGSERDKATIDRPDRDLRRAELAEQIDGALNTLSENRRPVLRMFLAGYDRHEIARLLGWSEAKTRNLLYRGLEDLRTELRHRGLGPRTEP